MTRRDSRIAWLALEQALPSCIDSAIAEDWLDDAGLYAERLIHRTDLPFRLFMDAALLKAYLPAFRARRNGQTYNQVERQNITNVTLALSELAQSAPVHTQRTHPDHLNQPDHIPCFARIEDQDGAVVKASAMLLALRTGLTIYPSSFRESGAAGGYDKQHLSYSHDFYALENDTKIPFKFKRSNKGDSYGRSLLFISFDGLVNGIAHKKNLITDGINRKLYPNKALSWLASEARGDSLAPAEQLFLDDLSQALKFRIKEFTDRF